MNARKLTADDVRQQWVQVVFGIDPPIRIGAEETHLRLLAEDFRKRGPGLFPFSHLGPDGLRITRTEDPNADSPVLLAQGHELWYMLAIEFPGPEERCMLAPADYRRVLSDMQDVCFRHLVGRVRTRVEYARHVIFDIDSAEAFRLVARRGAFARTPLIEAAVIAHFPAPGHHVVIQLAANKLTAAKPNRCIPGLTARVRVQSTQLPPLSDEAIAGILDVGDDFWPAAVLDYINDGNT